MVTMVHGLLILGLVPVAFDIFNSSISGDNQLDVSH